MLDIVIFAIFRNTDEVTSDEKSSCCACFLPWRLVVNVWVSMPKFCDVFIKPLNYLLF